MDLPSAANKIISQLKDLNISTAKVPLKLDEIADAVAQPLYERVKQLEEEIHGNTYRDFIRQEVQRHNDLVLDRKINDSVKLFQNKLNHLEQRVAELEHGHGRPYPQVVSADTEYDADNAATNEGNEPNQTQ
jgi:hypothetical protein